MTQVGTTKGINLASRNEYHQNAYRHYLEKQQNQIQLIDPSGQSEPILRNTQGESMNIFIKDLEQNLKQYYQSDNLQRDRVFDLRDGNTLIQQLQ